MTFDDLIRGDLVQVTWVDIYEDVVGDPDRAELARRVSVGYVWGQTTSFGQPCLVTTTTIDEKEHSQSGYCIYPSACVVALKRLKARRRRTKKEVAA